MYYNYYVHTQLQATSLGLTLQKRVRDFEISGFHGTFWDFSEDFN